MQLKPYKEYKESGIEWLHKIPKNWNVRRLKESANLRFSNVDKKSKDGQLEVELCNYVDVYKNDFIDNSINFMESTASESEVRRFNLKVGDVLFTKDSETFDDIANPAFVKETHDKLVCGYHLAMVRCNSDNLIGNYLFRLFQSIHFNYNFATSAKGITRVGLSISSINDVFVLLPPPSDQTHIATYLDRQTALIDRKIDLLTQKIEKYQELKKSLINETVCRGLDPSVPMKDSGVAWIGEVPRHWEVRRVKDFFSLITEQAPIDHNMELLSIYTAIGVRPRQDMEQRGNKAVDTTGYWVVKKGDIIVNKLLAWMGAIGLSNYDGVTSPAYDILRKKVLLDERFYTYLFRTELCQGLFKQHSRGIMEVRLRLYFDKFGALEMPFPSPEEQKEIADYIDEKSFQIDAITTNLTQQIETLKELRKTLINDVVTGKLKVPSAS